MQAVGKAIIPSIVVAFVSIGQVVAAPPADLVVVDASVITIDKNQPRAEAFAVSRGRFIAVGKTTDIRRWVGKKTKVINAGGKTVVPGFNDAHIHPGPLYAASSPLALVDCGPTAVKTIDELIAALKKKANITRKGQWVRGSRYQETKLRRHPTRWDLDKASTDHPIRISHSSGHLAVFNSYALKLARITKKTKDPQGGKFDRDKNGVPNGVCRERAASIVRAAGPKPPRATTDQRMKGYLARFRRYASKGITSVQHAGARYSKVEMYDLARSAGQPVRVYVMLTRFDLPKLKELKGKGKLGDDRLKVGAIKRFHGNSLSGQTCWLYEPYAKRPDYYGIPPRRSQSYLDRRILEVHQAGFQACVHSNGDREIDMVLNAFEKALKKAPRKDHRHRIEHCSIVNERILKRIKKLGVVLAPHSYIYEHGDKMEAYGKARWNMNSAGADHRINRIDRDRIDLDEQLRRTGHGLRKLSVLDDFGRPGLREVGGFHCVESRSTLVGRLIGLDLPSVRRPDFVGSLTVGLGDLTTINEASTSPPSRNPARSR